MKQLHHLDDEQVTQMKRDLAEMRLHTEEMVNLMSIDFGEQDKRTIRAAELLAGIQRLEWAIDRAGEGGADIATIGVGEHNVELSTPEAGRKVAHKI